jgi:hypothetical protein
VRYLVVGNITLGTAPLAEAIRERAAARLCEFHVLVPATSWQGYPEEFLRGLQGRPLGPPEDHREGPVEIAQFRLDRELERLRGEGVRATGSVGAANPVEAVKKLLAEHKVDEIIVSTLPVGPSRWLRMDLLSRVRRTAGVPVVHVLATNPLEV